MSNSFSAFLDDYKDYVRYCKTVGASPISDRATRSFYDHWRELQKKEQQEKHGG